MKKIIGILVLVVSFIVAQDFGDLLSRSDALHEVDDYSASFELLKQAEQLESDNYENVWRLARGHFDFADNSEDKDVISENFYAGLDYAKKALEMNDGRAESHKWYGILIGKVGELEGTKQKIINSYEVKEHTLKAIELDPSDDGNYHVMGRWNFELSKLSWFKKKIARMIYGKLPKASFDEAAEYFQQAIAIAPDEIRHHLWLGQTFKRLKDKDAARNSYNAALAIPAETNSDRILQKDAEKLLSDL